MKRIYNCNVSNPVQNVLHINLSGKAGILEVFDIIEKTVLQKQIRENNP